MNEKFLARLKEAQQAHMQESLTAPSAENRSTFEFGRRCGYLAGLQKAEAIFIDLLKEKAVHDRKQ